MTRKYCFLKNGSHVPNLIYSISEKKNYFVIFKSLNKSVEIGKNSRRGVHNEH